MLKTPFRRLLSVVSITACLLAVSFALSAQQPPPTATPESVGLSAQRLERLHAGMQALVDRRQVAGTVTLVARDGKIVDVHASGFQDLERKTPMRADSIFRIASMTKPVTSVAILMLYEEGKLQLNDPVSRYIPAFRQMRVEGRGGETAPARRGITIEDLLTHRSGLTYRFLNGGPVGDAYRAAGVTDGLDASADTLEQAIDKLAAQPLVSQPGEAWNYSLSSDVLGRVVEVVSGETLDVFMRERIFTPLGMTDTAFEVPQAKWDRFAGLYTPDRNGGGLRAIADPETIGNTVISPFAAYRAPRKYLSGGAGLTSTAGDYARFAQMLLNGGELNGARLLSPKTVQLLTMSHTADLPSGGVMGAGMNWGLGVRMVVNLADAQMPGSTGMYGWIGIYGTMFWVDPKEHLVMVMMVQRYPGSPAGATFEPLVYQAITKSYIEP